MSSEIHDELRTVARQVLGKADPDVAQLTALGWLGLEVPESLDGAGATFAEVGQREAALLGVGRERACVEVDPRGVVGAGPERVDH